MQPCHDVLKQSLKNLLLLTRSAPLRDLLESVFHSIGGRGISPNLELSASGCLALLSNQDESPS